MLSHYAAYARLSLMKVHYQLNYASDHSHPHTEYRVRTERFASTMSYTNAFSYLTGFYTNAENRTAGRASQEFKSGIPVSTQYQTIQLML